jgi:diaminohydroxyphosphoribosylaminopyrimidine deaminase/5-amino-6-(5-phosphoribosylamino)uracil reductase
MQPAGDSKFRTRADRPFLRLALKLARRGYGATSPNPMVGAVLVKKGKVIGRGWHHRAGAAHAEIEALRDALKHGHHARGATLYVTLEPCSTQGRTPPCTDALIAAGIKRLVVGATDPNPRHRGHGFAILRRAGISVQEGVLAEDCKRLNESFNHWIVHRTPFVTVKAAMTLDGKIATASGESKWITGEKSRARAMKLRGGTDAILVGINTVLADDPKLTVRKIHTRPSKSDKPREDSPPGSQSGSRRRIVLDARARTPLDANVVSDEYAALTTIVVSVCAPRNRVAALAKRVRVLVAPTVAEGVGQAFQPAGAGDFPVARPSAAEYESAMCQPPRKPARGLGPTLDLRWLLKKLGQENITSLLVEGGGEVNASFLMQGLAQRIAFFYAPKVLGGRHSRHAVAGEGATSLNDSLNLTDLKWQRLDPDLLLTARIA